MATFTLQRGLADIHSLRYHHADNSHPTIAPSKQTDPRPRRTSQQHQATGDSQHRLSAVTRESTSTLDPLSRPDAPSDSSVIPLKTHPEEQNGNRSSSRIEVPVLARPISSDSIMAASDGGKHGDDVEDEGRPSTVMMGSRTERTPQVLSERARGKLPEGHRAPPFTREPSSDIDGQGIDFASSKKEHTSTAGGSKLGRRSSSTILGQGVGGKSRQEQETTAKDVGQNGFIPTAEWVAYTVSL